MSLNDDSSSPNSERAQTPSLDAVMAEKYRDLAEGESRDDLLLVYLFEVAKRTVLGLLQDNCFRYSAALSFYALFSIAPMGLKY